MLQMELSGSAYKRGYEHGRQCPGLIYDCFKRFCEFKGAKKKRLNG